MNDLTIEIIQICHTFAHLQLTYLEERYIREFPYILNNTQLLLAWLLRLSVTFLINT
jgi:hypothetical protein